MTLARELTRQGHQVTLIEGAPSTGGLASAAKHGEFMWDRFYHVTLLSDLNLRSLLSELGLEDRMRWGVTRTGFYTDGRLYSLSNNLEFLAFPPLSLLDKFRLGLTIFRASKISNGLPLERESVAEWLTRLSGRRVFERIWLPLLRSKLGDNYRIASAAFIWAIIARMYAARRSGLKKEMFGYVDGGYALVLDRFQAQLDEMGVRTLTGTRVTRVVQEEDGARIETASGGLLTFDKVILTVPCGRIADICPGLASAEQSRLRGVTYQGIACASVLLKRPLASYYVTNITETWVPFTGVIEMTTLVAPATFGGNSLVYLPRYLTQDDPFWELDDAAIRERFISALELMYPVFRRDDVLSFHVSRVREVLAVSTLNYSRDRLPALRTSLKDVFIVNSAQIAQGTLNVNETVGLAMAQAKALAPQVASTRPPAGVPAA
jgi:protoporphyrinogen oxidase